MFRFYIIVYFIILLSISLFGQQNNNGILSGKVLNAKNNQSVPFANIVIWGTNQGTISDEDGNFLFTGINPGYIELRASTVGFKTYVSEPILITNADRAYIEILMEETR